MFSASSVDIGPCGRVRAAARPGTRVPCRWRTCGAVGGVCGATRSTCPVPHLEHPEHLCSHVYILQPRKRVRPPSCQGGESARHDTSVPHKRRMPQPFLPSSVPAPALERCSLRSRDETAGGGAGGGGGRALVLHVGLLHGCLGLRLCLRQDFVRHLCGEGGGETGVWPEGQAALALRPTRPQAGGASAP